ncbi:phage tail protein [Enterobacter hormaechei]|nr:phage tail protein [Enterobacter hormaechei]
MIYTTGTIAISGNTLTGTGTNFTAAGSLIRNGCTVIALTSPAQVFQITAIGSATSLTVTPAANPAVPSGTKYAILLSDSLSVDGLAQDIAETFTMYQRYMSGFADVMNGTSDVTITINGTAVTVPGQKSLAKKGANSDITSLSGLKTALSIGQGGTGATNAADARSNLGLGYGDTAGTVCQGNDSRLNTLDGKTGGAVKSTIHMDTGSAAVAVQTAGYAGADAWHDQIVIGGSIRWRMGLTDIGSSGGHRIIWQFRNLGGDGYRQVLSLYPNDVIYTSGNTTKASDGTLKAASPIARIVKSQEDNQRTDIDEAGFTWCGCGTANAEAEGITLSRLDVGVYMLTGSAGLASSGWQLLPPMDPSGMGELGVVEAEQTDSGELTIRLFKRKYILSGEGEVIKTKGEPIDVPANSWIDVRLDMPADSIWNTKVSGSSLELQ